MPLSISSASLTGTMKFKYIVYTSADIKDPFHSAIAFITDGHVKAENQIKNSGMTYTISDVADILSEISGRKITYLDPPKEVYTEQLIKAGVPEMYVGFTAAFAEAIRRDEFDLPGTTLESLLGRKPMSLKAFLQTVYGTSK